MDAKEIHEINREHVIQLASLIKKLNSNKCLGFDTLNQVSENTTSFLLISQKNIENELVEEGILKVHNNGNYEFLIEEYKWLFRKTYEDLIN